MKWFCKNEGTMGLEIVIKNCGNVAALGVGAERDY